jgi:DNA-binding PadR family transcriptional regulator
MKTNNFYILRPSIALEIGEAEAALLEKIAVFCRGKAHTLKGYDGKWIYNSVASWKEQHFQHWSESKIYRALKSLEEKNLIISKKASFRGRQNIRWYSVTEVGYKLLNDNTTNASTKSNANQNNYHNHGFSLEEFYSNNFHITKQEVARDVVTENTIQVESTANTSSQNNGKNDIPSYLQLNLAESLCQQDENNCGQIDELYYIAERQTKKTSFKITEEEKYFELAKEQNQKPEQKKNKAPNLKKEKSQDKKKAKTIKDLDNFIEQEVERRIWERDHEEREREFAREMDRIYKEYIESIENEGKESKGGSGAVEPFADFIKARLKLSDNNKSKFEEKAEEYVDIANQKGYINLNSKKVQSDTANLNELQRKNSLEKIGVINCTTSALIASTLEDNEASETSQNQEDKQSTIRMIIDLWNKVFEHSVNPIKAYASKNNQEALLTLYKTVFNSDLNNWREYALKVNSSQFLMGEKKTKNNFKAVFGWLIKPETIEKILSGEYGVGDRELDVNNKAKNAEIIKEQKVTELEMRVTSNLKENLNELQELEEFRNYIEEEGYERDNDKYKLGMLLRHIPKRNFLHGEEYKLIRDRVFESYLMKKHTDQSRLNIRDKLRAAVNSRSEIFNKSKDEKTQITKSYLEENTKNSSLLARGVSGGQAANLINKQIRSK